MVGASDKLMRTIRGKRIAMIFQDPLSALNPVQKIGVQIVEMIRSHEDTPKAAAHRKAVELLDVVGIPQPDQRAMQYPHEFSGGMRQRVMIAMAIANEPEVLIADEPTTWVSSAPSDFNFDLGFSHTREQGHEAVAQMAGALPPIVEHNARSSGSTWPGTSPRAPGSARSYSKVEASTTPTRQPGADWSFS